MLDIGRLAFLAPCLKLLLGSALGLLLAFTLPVSNALAFPAPEVWWQLLAHVQSATAALGSINGLIGLTTASTVTAGAVYGRRLRRLGSAPQSRRSKPIFACVLVAALTVLALQLASELSHHEDVVLNRKPPHVVDTSAVFFALDEAGQAVHPNGIHPDGLTAWLGSNEYRAILFAPAPEAIPRWPETHASVIQFPADGQAIDLDAMLAEVLAIHNQDEGRTLLIDKSGFLAGRLAVMAGGHDQDLHFIIGGEDALVAWARDLPAAPQASPGLVARALEVRDQLTVIDSRKPFEFYDSGYLYGANRMTLAEFVLAAMDPDRVAAWRSQAMLITGYDSAQTEAIAALANTLDIDVRYSARYSLQAAQLNIPNYRNRDTVLGWRDTVREVIGNEATWLIDSRSTEAYSRDKLRLPQTIHIPVLELSEGELAQRLAALDLTRRYLGSAYAQLDGFQLRRIGYEISQAGGNWLGTTTATAAIPPSLLDEVESFANPSGIWPLDLLFAVLKFELFALTDGIAPYLRGGAQVEASCHALFDAILQPNHPRAMLVMSVVFGFLFAMALNCLAVRLRYLRGWSLDPKAIALPELVLRLLVTLIMGLVFLNYLSTSGTVAAGLPDAAISPVKPYWLLSVLASIAIGVQLLMRDDGGRLKHLVAWVLAAGILWLVLKSVPAAFCAFILGIGLAGLGPSRIKAILHRVGPRPAPMVLENGSVSALAPGEETQTGIHKIDNLFHAARLFPGSVLSGLLFRLPDNKLAAFSGSQTAQALGDLSPRRAIFRSAMPNEDALGSEPGRYESQVADLSGLVTIEPFTQVTRDTPRNLLVQPALNQLQSGHVLSRSPDDPDRILVDVLYDAADGHDGQPAQHSWKLPRGFFAFIAWAFEHHPSRFELLFQLRRWALALEHEFSTTVMLEWVRDQRKPWLVQVRPMEEVNLFDADTAYALGTQRGVPRLSNWSRRDLDQLLPNARTLPADVVVASSGPAITYSHGRLWQRVPLWARVPRLPWPVLFHRQLVMKLDALFDRRQTQQERLTATNFSYLSLVNLQHLVVDVLSAVKEETMPLIWQWDRLTSRYAETVLPYQPGYEGALTADHLAAVSGLDDPRSLAKYFGHRGSIDLDVSCPRFGEWVTSECPKDIKDAIDSLPPPIRPLTFSDVKQDLHDLLARDYALLRRAFLEIGARLGLGDAVFDLPLTAVLSADLHSSHELQRLAGWHAKAGQQAAQFQIPDTAYGWQLSCPKFSCQTEGCPNGQQPEGPKVLSTINEPVAGKVLNLGRDTKLDRSALTGAIVIIRTERTDLYGYLDDVAGAVIVNGRVTSHLAIAFRMAGKPVIAMTPGELADFKDGDTVTLSANGLTA